jgi:hypothetical protein
MGLRKSTLFYKVAHAYDAGTVMSAVTKFFFRAPTTETTSWSIVLWWESRRMAYNLVVGAAGVTTIGLATLFAILPPHPIRFTLPWELVLVYGVGANVCYTAGPILDLAICRAWGDGYTAVGPTLFRYGFAFSLGLTLLPIPLAAGSWVIRSLQVLLGG